MANVKQRYIKPGRDFNYSEGVKVKATAAVYADQIVYVDGSSGPFLKVSPADADLAAGANGRLMIAKHDIAAGSYGIVLPWKLVTTVATDSVAVGAAIYLADTVTAGVAGNLSLTAPNGDAKVVVVGRVTVSATVANGGAILVHADAPEERVQGGAVSATSSQVGRPTEQLKVVLPQSTNNCDITLPYGIIITDVHTISAGTATDTAIGIKGTGADAIFTAIAFGGADGTRVQVAVISRTHSAIPAGTVLRTRKGGNGDVGDIVVYTFIRA